MPTSDPVLLTPICQEIVRLQPATVLDIGCGSGKWGFLARDYTDIWNERYDREQWQTTITGVDVFADYHNSTWDNYYDDVIIGDITSVVDELGTFDLIIMTEVLEHIEKKQALELLDKIMQKGRAVIFSYTNSRQEDLCGNEHERHISSWKYRDIKHYKPRLLARLKRRRRNLTTKTISEIFIREQ